MSIYLVNLVSHSLFLLAIVIGKEGVQESLVGSDSFRRILLETPSN